jgi:microcystin-dependent protein
MSTPYIGQIRIFGFNFAPLDWAFCNGEIVAISQNTALFSILGTTYGGNGTTTFALPNLQGLGVVNAGQGAGLSNYVLGELTGAATVTLNHQQMPSHTHQLTAASATSEDLAPTAGGWPGRIAAPGRIYSDVASPETAFKATAFTTAGSSQPHTNQQPYLVMNYCLAMFGIFPSRN